MQILTFSGKKSGIFSPFDTTGTPLIFYLPPSRTMPWQNRVYTLRKRLLVKEQFFKIILLEKGSTNNWQSCLPKIVPIHLRLKHKFMLKFMSFFHHFNHQKKNFLDFLLTKLLPCTATPDKIRPSFLKNIFLQK